MIGSPVGGNPLCLPFKNRPNRQNNRLWIESTRATIGKYKHFLNIIQDKALIIVLFPVCLLHYKGHDYYAHLINLPPVLTLCRVKYQYLFFNFINFTNAIYVTECIAG